MHKDDSRDVVGDAVDAVTLNQDVQWERCNLAHLVNTGQDLSARGVGLRVLAGQDRLGVW